MLIIASSLLLFILAGLCEIGGGYLFWQTLRENRSPWFAVAGTAVLILYGVAHTFQPAHFGRVYASYAGFFLVVALLWGWLVDKITPDRIDLIGSAIALIGVFIMMHWPRAAA